MGSDGIWIVMVTAVVFGGLAAIIVGPFWLKEQTRRSAHRLIAQALERNQAIDPALMERLTQSIEVQQRTPRKTLGNSVVLLALAIGFTGASLLDDGVINANDDTAIAALILGVLGAAFLILAIVDYRTKSREG